MSIETFMVWTDIRMSGAGNCFRGKCGQASSPLSEHPCSVANRLADSSMEISSVFGPTVILSVPALACIPMARRMRYGSLDRIATLIFFDSSCSFSSS